jgi:hypothetical protein
MRFGGADRDRTGDPLLAKQVLSQLSYSPTIAERLEAVFMVGLGRFELPTSPLSGVRSNQLSYRPRVEHSGWPAHPPGRIARRLSIKTHSIAKKVSRTRLNVRRAATPRGTVVRSESGKEGPTTIPTPAVRNGKRRLDEHSIHSPRRIRYRGKNGVPSFLF